MLKMIGRARGSAAMLACAAALSLAAGCAARPDEPSVSVPAGLTLEQVRRAIIEAGVANDWQMQEVDARTFRALHDHHAQEAAVLIDYDSTACTIRPGGRDSGSQPEQSSSLSTGAYDRWVEQLRQGIAARLQEAQ